MTNKLGNPALVAATNPDVIKSGKEIVLSYQEKAASTAKILLITGTTAFGIWYGSRKLREWRRQKFVENYANIPDVQAAMIMRKAMFRVEIDTFPFNMVTIPDGTNEAMLNALALKVSSIQNVIKAYRILFDSNLITDVASELGDNDLRKFFENLGAGNEYDTGFNPNGTPKPQTPYKTGQTLEVKNPSGTTIFKAGQRDNGLYYNTGTKRDFLQFSDTVGEILYVYKGVSGQFYYVVDMSWSPDFIRGHGWVAHTEVKPKN